MFHNLISFRIRWRDGLQKAPVKIMQYSSSLLRYIDHYKIAQISQIAPGVPACDLSIFFVEYLLTISKHDDVISNIPSVPSSTKHAISGNTQSVVGVGPAAHKSESSDGLDHVVGRRILVHIEL